MRPSVPRPHIIITSIKQYVLFCGVVNYHSTVIRSMVRGYIPFKVLSAWEGKRDIKERKPSMLTG